MSNENAQTDRTDTQPASEPAPTPLISAAEIPAAKMPCQPIKESRFDALSEVARRIAETTKGTADNHVTGKLGELGFDDYLGLGGRLNTEVRPDGGDGGSDLTYRGATIDVKTVGRHRSDPALTIDAYEPLRADYYVLTSRIGQTDCRLIGYAPRHFVANAPIRYHNGEPYHFVDQHYLFPFPRF
jgi:hypothetical protein